MPLFFLTLVTVFPALLGVNAGSFNYSYCAEIARTIFYENPNNISLYDEHGEPTSNLSKAWGISYYDCKNTCGAQDNTGYYDWGFLSQGVASWLIPWLALSAQLPFETKGQTTNLVALFLAIGSPALITYSLALRILGARWINSKFRQVKENNATLRRPLQTKAIKAARSILIETQHVPIQVYNGPRREIAQLIVNPENWAWWCSLQNRILIRKRKWTYSLYAQVGWVCLTQLLAIIDFFTSASSNSTIGIGLAINSLWLWMIPITLGWVYVGTQDSAGSIKAALVDTIVPSLAPDRNNNGECFGFRDRTVADDSSMTPQDSFNGGEQAPQHEKASPINSFLDSGLPKIDPEIDRKHTDSTLSISPRELEKPPVSFTDHPENSYTSHSEHLELYGHSRYPLKGSESTLTTLEGQTQSLSDDLVCSSLLRQNFLGFSVAGDEIEPGPIFNYARVWSHMSAANHVAESFRRFTVRQKMRQPVTHGKSWNKCLDRWDENLQGTPQEMSKYISSDNSDAEIFPVHAPASARLVLNCVTAAFVAMFLQWGTTVRPLGAMSCLLKLFLKS